MGIAVMLSRLLGLVREQVFAYFFGASHAMDAFNIAFRIPNLFRDLFAEGAMSSALIPTFVKVQKKEGEKRAWQVAFRIGSCVFFAACVVALLGQWVASPLVSLYAGAFKQVPGKLELTVGLTRVLFWFFPWITLAAIWMGILNAKHWYFWPAFGSAVFNAVTITVGAAGVLWWSGVFSNPIFAMAWAMVLGAFCQAWMQWPALKKAGLFWNGWRWVFKKKWIHDRSFQMFFHLIFPALIGLAATQVNIFVNSVLASMQGRGAVSWLNYAFRLMQLPIGLIGVSLGMASLPHVSKLWQQGDLKQIRQTLVQTLRQLFFLILPAAVGLWVLGPLVVSVLFEQGKFTSYDVFSTARALSAYAVGLGAYGALKVLVPTCYGIGKTKIAVQASFLAVIFNLALNLLFVHWLGYWGLALGTSCTAWIQVLFLMHRLRTPLQGDSGVWKKVWKGFFMFGTLALGMGGLCYETLLWLAPWFIGGKGAKAALLGVLVLEGIIFIFSIAKACRFSEGNFFFKSKKV